MNISVGNWLRTWIGNAQKKKWPINLIEKKVSINEMQTKTKSYNFYNSGQFDSLKMLSTLFW